MKNKNIKNPKDILEFTKTNIKYGRLNTQIIEYEEKYLEDVRDLLVELEEYILSIDKDN